jgi:hypothetical protein
VPEPDEPQREGGCGSDECIAVATLAGDRDLDPLAGVQVPSRLDQEVESFLRCEASEPTDPQGAVVVAVPSGGDRQGLDAVADDLDAAGADPEVADEHCADFLGHGDDPVEPFVRSAYRLRAERRPEGGSHVDGRDGGCGMGTRGQEQPQVGLWVDGVDVDNVRLCGGQRLGQVTAIQVAPLEHHEPAMTPGGVRELRRHPSGGQHGAGKPRRETLQELDDVRFRAAVGGAVNQEGQAHGHDGNPKAGSPARTIAFLIVSPASTPFLRRRTGPGRPTRLPA